MPSEVEQLIQELIPHSPTLGLYLAPDIPEGKLRNAIDDYARSVDVGAAIALYDATLSGNAKDGAVFTSDRLVFQNNDLSPVQEVRYDDIVAVKAKRKFLGGKKVQLDVNRGRATVKFVLDFSGKPGAAEFVARFLFEAMMHSIEREEQSRHSSESTGTDLEAVRRALDGLVEDGTLASKDRDTMLRSLRD